MKNIKLIRLLLPITLLVWAFIMYRIFTVVVVDDDKVIVKNQTITKIQNQNIQEDTFALLVNYPDPFLTRRKVYSTKHNSNTISRRKNIKKKKNEPHWPNITYLGVLQNSNSGIYSASLIINGKNVILSVGKKSLGIQLTQVCSDSVQLLYENHTKNIKMQN
ncbi:MAG: hypothetical protein QM503_03150 [Bacteroidota bacterium]